MEPKKIRIGVTAAAMVPRSRLKVIQDVDDKQLKTLSDEDYVKLRDEICDRGYKYAQHVWPDPDTGDLCILDGTQRARGLDRLLKEGRTLENGEHETWILEDDLVPVNFVQAENIKEAVLTLVSGASSYGRPSDEGLSALMNKFGIKLPEIKNSAFLNINPQHFALKFFPTISPVSGEPIPEEKEEEIPEPPKVAKTKRGELWVLGAHRLLIDDCTIKENVGRLVASQTIDMVFTDPPYGVDYEGVTNDHLKDAALRKFILDAFSAIDPFVRPGAAFYIWHPDIHAYEFIGAVKDVGWQLARPSTIQWLKNSLVLSQGDYHSRNEPCLYGWKPGAGHKRVEDRSQDTIWEFPKPSRSEEHPTMKPLGLAERAINNSSERSWTIVDTFLGSGTTLIACEKTGRRCLGMELEPNYADVILSRWHKLTGIDPVREDGILWSQL